LTVQLYEDKETDAALQALAALSKELPDPYLLVGGWAVYLTVNESYQKEHGVPYLGSRDIDLGFHIDGTCDDETLRTCNYSKAQTVLQNVGYVPHGSFRYLKIIKKETGEVLTEKEASKFPQYEVFYLYVDMMVDNIHPNHKQYFKIEPLDEPLIARVFSERCGISKIINGATVMVPPPHILLATKLKAIPNRTKDDKLWKDACDIYAIIWHSQSKYRDVLSAVKKDYSEYCEKALEVISSEVIARAANHLDVDKEAYIELIEQLKG